MPIITEDSPITFNDALPKAVDVVIVGGGIAGVMAAWFLSKAGKSVFICEKGRVAGEQSSRNWGFVRQAGRDSSELPMMIDGRNCKIRWEMLSDSGDPALYFAPAIAICMPLTKRGSITLGNRMACHAE
jgi:glycine/D-amino acid oxidase-like deaminating enzyme